MHLAWNTAWQSEIGSLTSQFVCTDELASSDVRKPISLHQPEAVCARLICFFSSFSAKLEQERLLRENAQREQQDLIDRLKRFELEAKKAQDGQ